MVAYYRIQIDSYLGVHWSSWFNDLEIINNDDGTTTLQGVLLDQPALWGVLARIQSAGMTLLTLQRFPEYAALDARPAARSTLSADQSAAGDHLWEAT